MLLVTKNRLIPNKSDTTVHFKKILVSFGLLNTSKLRTYTGIDCGR